MARVLAKSNNGDMLKIEVPTEAKGYIWYFLSPKVKEFVTNHDIKAGSEIDYKNEEIQGEPTITFINQSNATEFKCEICQAPLKNDKYKTCYNCSMKSREEENKSPEGQARQDSIQKQAMMKASAEIVAGTAQQGTPPDLLADMTISIYEKLLARLLK